QYQLDAQQQQTEDDEGFPALVRSAQGLVAAGRGRCPGVGTRLQLRLGRVDEVGRKVRGARATRGIVLDDLVQTRRAGSRESWCRERWPDRDALPIGRDNVKGRGVG